MNPTVGHLMEIAALVVTGTMTGNEIAVAVFFHPCISRLDDATHIRAVQPLARALGAAMPFWYALSLLLCLGVTFLVDSAWNLPRFLALSASGVLAFTVVYTLLLPVPINNQVARWQPDTVPSNWRELRRRWDRLHAIRVGFLIVAFILLAASAII